VYHAKARRREDRGETREGRDQRTEDRGQRTEDRGQRTEDRGQRTEDRGQRTEIGGQTEEKVDLGSQMRRAAVSCTANIAEGLGYIFNSPQCIRRIYGEGISNYG